VLNKFAQAREDTLFMAYFRMMTLGKCPAACPTKSLRASTYWLSRTFLFSAILLLTDGPDEAALRPPSLPPTTFRAPSFHCGTGIADGGGMSWQKILAPQRTRPCLDCLYTS
jgi:hypothetical protein